MEHFKIKTDEEGKKLIFDPVRRKYVALTPEEQVRQHTLHFLLSEKDYPPSLIAVEKSLKLYKTTKRTDIVAYNREGKAMLLVECKAPHIKLSQKTFDQAFRYNINLKVPFLVITNGEEIFCCEISSKGVTFMDEIPSFEQLNQGLTSTNK